MRHLFTGFITALLLTSLATQAEARRGGGYTIEQELIFVSPTTQRNQNGPLALCHLVKTTGLFFSFNLWRTLEGYALAENNCDTESYYALSAEDVKTAQALGQIPDTVPIEPKLSFDEIIKGFWMWSIIGLLVFGALFKGVQVSRRRKMRMKLLAGATPTQQAILDAMCHAAKSDGYVAPSEIETIKHAAEEITGMAFSLEAVKKLAGLAEENLNKHAFKRLFKGCSKLDQLVMMRGVLMVVAADGRLDGKENVFVGSLAKAMSMDNHTVSMLLAEVTKQPETA